jgi:hypothetical protein
MQYSDRHWENGRDGYHLLLPFCDFSKVMLAQRVRLWQAGFRGARSVSKRSAGRWSRRSLAVGA